VRGISQFVDGSDLLLTRYGNPLDLTESVGVSRTLIKNDLIDWSTRLGAAARQLIDRKKLDIVNGGRATDITNDGGAEMNMDLKASNTQNWATLLSQLRVYEALASSKADEFTGDSVNFWRYPHIKWDNTLTLTFAKYLMINFSAYLLYDKDINDDVRLKEVFAAGLTYNYIKK
jgi:hypothetical protein